MPDTTDKKFQDVEFGEDLPEIEPDISLDTVKLFSKSALMLAPRPWAASAIRSATERRCTHSGADTTRRDQTSL